MSGMQHLAWAVVVVVLAGNVSWVTTAHAQQSERRAQSRMATAEIPVQIGVGPAGLLFGGPTYPDFGFRGALFDDQAVHSGLRISLTAIIEEELVREHRDLVPRQYHQQIINAGEVRYAPGILAVIPSTLYLSPSLGEAMAWGGSWSLLGAGLAFSQRPVRTSLSGAVIATLMYINSASVAAEHYFFVRPGLELNLDFEVPITSNLLISVGWNSMVHLPQSLDGVGMEMLSMGSFDERSLWHIGQFYLQTHFRVPYSYQYRRR